jgi:hypothetical protein
MVKSVKSKNDVGDIVISEAPEPSDELSISDDEKAEISERNRRVIETAKSKLQKRVDTLTRRVQ